MISFEMMDAGTLVWGMVLTFLSAFAVFVFVVGRQYERQQKQSSKPR